MGVGRENLGSRMAELFSRMAPDTFLERFYFETISIHELAIDTIACFECCSGCIGFDSRCEHGFSGASRSRKSRLVFWRVCHRR